MPSPFLSSALDTTRHAWLAGDPEAWALYRSCCSKLGDSRPLAGATAHRAAVASRAGRGVDRTPPSRGLK